MAVIYNDYTRARIGWFFGLSGLQLAIVALSSVPVAWSIQQGAWSSAVMFLTVWAAVTAVTVVPVRGRSALGWVTASVTFALGGLTGWSRFRARAAIGRADPRDDVDLPGVLAGIAIHDGPPTGVAGTRVAIIQNHADRTWAVTAAVVHPGIGMRDGPDRARLGRGLSELLDQASRTELIAELLFLVRTVPEDGAEREQWISAHRRPDGPPQARIVNDELGQHLTQASVRTEAFLTVVVPETRLGREAKESGGGLEGRARVLYGLIGEVETHLKAGLGMTSVTWLSSPDLAIACRTGFAPGDRAAIIDGLAKRDVDPGVNADVPWAMAGPSGADPVARHYSHDAWNSICAAIKLPVKGAVMGALAPVLVPTEPGERRSYLVAYPVLTQSTAARASATGQWMADLGQALREKAKVKQGTKSADEADQVRLLEAKLARGNALTLPYAVCAVTVPKTARVAEAGRRLDAAVRRAGFAPLRLDLSQDTAFAAAAVPLGVSLTRQGDA